jgi:hypothetical protein
MHAAFDAFGLAGITEGFHCHDALSRWLARSTIGLAKGAKANSAPELQSLMYGENPGKTLSKYSIGPQLNPPIRRLRSQ